MQISLSQISKHFKDCTALEDVSMTIEKGELIALLGPSGSGKTTLLKIISGLETTSQGQIIINNENVTKLSTKDRNIGFVFQHYALFKHMTVFDNIAFGQRVKPRKSRLDEEEITERVHELSGLVQIENLYNRYPHELSGGQRQRVALARALAIEPQILLLDEPFAALDAKLKLALRRWLRNLQKKTNITIVLVTHDQEEAFDIADRIVLLNEGNIEQIGTPKELYHSPDNPFVYNFLGHYNVFKAIKDSQGNISILTKQDYSLAKQEKWYDKHKIVSSIANLLKTSTQNKDSHKNKIKEYFEVFVRPHDMEITNTPLDGYIAATITHLNLAGPSAKLELESTEYELIQAEISQKDYEKLDLKKGALVYTKAKQVTMFT
jgi:sulfate/thiosulfate transport system ATP-binding protein